MAEWPWRDRETCDWAEPYIYLALYPTIALHSISSLSEPLHTFVAPALACI